MSRHLGDRLPEPVGAEIDSDSPAAVAVPLLTLDEAGFPHVALLSYLELARHDEAVLFWLYSDSTSVRWLGRHPACTLLFASERGVFYVKGRARPVAELEGQTVFQMDIESVLEDRPTRAEGDAGLLCGLRFRLPEAVAEGKRDFKARVIRRSR